jgi:hypothetical protein
MIAAFRCAGVISFSKPFLASLKVVSPATGPLEQARLNPPIRVSDPATDISLNMSQIEALENCSSYVYRVGGFDNTEGADLKADALFGAEMRWRSFVRSGLIFDVHLGTGVQKFSLRDVPAALSTCVKLTMNGAAADLANKSPDGTALFQIASHCSGFRAAEGRPDVMVFACASAQVAVNGSTTREMIDALNICLLLLFAKFLPRAAYTQRI